MEEKISYGNVFIAWSGADTGRKLAEKVKQLLPNYNYSGVIGGETLEGTKSVGESIFEEINKCVNAIILLSPSTANKSFSFNTAIEWGYCHKQFKASEEVFLINGAKLGEFDIQGMNANEIKEVVDFENESQLITIATQIASKFNDKQAVKRNKAEIDYLEIINDYAGVEDEMRRADIVPYDLAKHILLYTQSAYIFHRLADSRRAVQEFKNNNRLRDPILRIAIDYSLTSFKMFESVKAVDGNKAMDDSDFVEIKQSLQEQENDVKELPDSNLKKWLFVSIYKNLSYVYYVKAVETKDKDYIDKCLEYGEKCADLCDDLYIARPSYGNYAMLVKSYMYRNFYSLAITMGWAKAKEYSDKSYRAKKELHSYVKGNQTLQQDFIDNIETEYYLSIAENMKYFDDQMTIDGYVKTLDEFIGGIYTRMRRRLSSLKYMETVIQKEKLKLFIFDFDLTIADTREASKAAYREAFALAGVSDQYHESNVVTYLAEHLKDTFNRIADNSKVSYTEFLQKYIDVFAEQFNKVKLYDDAVEIINTLLKKKKRVLIYSNRDKNTINELILRDGRLTSVPEIIASSETSTKRKSSDDIIRYMEIYNSESDTTIYFGDSDEDKATAVSADVEFVRVDRYDQYKENKYEIIKDFTSFFK